MKAKTIGKIGIFVRYFYEKINTYITHGKENKTLKHNFI